MRGLGVTAALRHLPDFVVPVFALLTQLGDVWFVFLVVFSLYLAGARLLPFRISRPDAAFVLALALGALALTAGLKGSFELPRPPMPRAVRGLRYVPSVLRGVYIDAATASGYGFPSGHALLSTVFWGGLAVVLDAGTKRRRAVVAGIVVGLVCLARLVLGVHYLVDVVAGVAVGVVYLSVVVGLAGGRTRAAFRVASVVAIAGVFVGGVTFASVSTLGAALGGFVTWELLGRRVRPDAAARRTRLLTTLAGLALLGGGFGAIYVLGPPLVVVGFANAAVFAGVLALPVAVEYLENRRVPAR